MRLLELCEIIREPLNVEKPHSSTSDIQASSVRHTYVEQSGLFGCKNMFWTFQDEFRQDLSTRAAGKCTLVTAAIELGLIIS